MRSSQHQVTGSHHPHNSVRSPEISGSIRRPSSNDRVVARSFAGTLGASEFPIVDAQARYSISYVPGMSEHMVNTGKTLPEAQLKVVLFACEVERLNTLNYNLVKENEILKAQGTKSNREEDLETKLAIVLAENEKLNQIVEELQAVYSRERESLANEDYERRIADLLDEAEKWKRECKKLEGSAGHDSGNLRHIIEDLQRERENLREQLGKQSRDLDAMRARLGSIHQGEPADVRLLQEQISHLKIENEKMKSELHTMKLKYGNADALQQKLNQYDSRVRVLLDENDKLNHLLAEKSRELVASQNMREINVVHHPEERAVRAIASPVQSPSHDLRNAEIERMRKDNEELRSLLVQSQAASHGNNDLREKATRLAAENDRLNSLVIELRTEAEHLRRQVAGYGDGNKRAEQLTVQINTLLDENRRLNTLLEAKSKEEDFRTKSAQLISENDRLNLLVHDLRADNENLRRHAAESGKTEHLTSQLTALLAENKKLNDLLVHRVAEIEKLNGLVVELRTESEHLRRQVAEGHGAGNRRVEQLTIQINSLLDENRRLNTLLEAKSKEEDYKTKSVQLIGENDRLNKLVLDLRSDNEHLRRHAAESGKVEHLTSQLNALLVENQKVSDLLAHRTTEIESLKSRNRELELSSGSVIDLRNKVNVLVTETERLNSLVTSLSSENERLKRQATDTTRISELTTQLNTILAENGRLNDTLGVRVREIESLKLRVRELETSSHGITELRASIQSLNAQIHDLRAENDRLRIQVVDAEKGSGARVTQLTVQINSLLEENKRLNLLVHDSEALRRRIAELEVGAHATKELRDKVLLMTADNEKLNSLIVELRTENDRLRRQSVDTSQINHLNIQITGLHDENRKLNALVKERSEESDRLRRRVPELEATVGALRSDNERLVRQVGESTHSREKVDQLTHQINTLLSENQRLNGLLLEKHEHGSKVTELTAQVNGLSAENRRLNELLTQRLSETESLRRRLTEVETASLAVNDLRSKLSLTASENERLNVLITEQRGELDKLRLQVAEASRSSHLSGQVNSLLGENQRLNEVLIQKSNEVDGLRRRVMEAEDLKNRVTIVSSENDRLTATINELRAELEHAKAHSDTGRVHELTGHVSNLHDENRKLSSLVADRTAEMDHLKRRANESQELNIQLSKLQDENKRQNSLILEKEHELESLRRRLFDAESGGKNVEHLNSRITVLTGDVERLNHYILDLQKENDRLKAQSTDAHGAKARIEQLTLQVNTLLTENNRLTDTLSNRLREVEELRLRVSTGTTVQSSGNLNDLRAVLVILAAENERLSALVEQSKTRGSVDETSNLRNTINHLTNELDQSRRKLLEVQAGAGETEELRKKVQSLVLDSQSFNGLLKDKVNEIDALKTKIYTLEATAREADALRLRISQLEASQGSGAANEGLRSAFVLLAAENDRLNALVKGGAPESSSHRTVELAQSGPGVSEALLANYAKLEAENQRLTRLLASTPGSDAHRTVTLTSDIGHASNAEVEGLKRTLTDRDNEIETLRKRLQFDQSAELRSRVEVLLNENEQLNNHLTEKMREIEALRRRVAELEGKPIPETKEEAHHGIVASIKDKITQGIEKITGSEGDKSVEYKAQIDVLMTERDTLKRLLDEKTKEVDNLRSRPEEGRGAEIGVEIHRHGEGAKKAGVLPAQEDIVHFGDQGEVNKLRGIIAEKEREIEALNRRTQEADFLKQENERVTRLLTDKLREIEELSGKRSATPSTLVSTTAGTERSQDVDELRKRIVELEATLAQREAKGETRQAQEEGHGAEEKPSTGIFAAVKDKVKEKIAHGIEKLTGSHLEGTTATHEGGDLEAEYARLLDQQISDVNARFNEERQQFQRNEEELSLKIQKLEEELRMLTAEKDKLASANEKSKQEVENWKKRYEHFENQKDMEMDSLKLDLEKKYRESPSRKGIPEQVIDLEDRVTYLNNEIERLQDHLNMTLTELEEWRKRYSELEVLRAQEIDELRQQFDNSKKSSIEAKELQVKFNAERTAYEAQMLQLQQKVGDLQNEIKGLTAENEKLNKLSISRLEELEDLRRAHGGSTTTLTSSQTLEITQLKTQLESYKAASHNVKQLAIKYSAEKAADLSQIRQLKQINENYKSELEKLYELLDERKADFESLTKQNEELLKMYEKLVSVSTEKSGDVSTSQERSSFTPKDLSELESTREQYQRNSIELTRKNKELVDKLQELDILKMKYEEALANYQALNARLFEKLNAER